MLPYIFLLIIIFLDFAWERSLSKKNIVKEISTVLFNTNTRELYDTNK